ncbi:MAG: DUF4091 domain-containing protein [Clostridia bacterium]|nr:DUF4091 domain-containing protein [Clostridia bacterium]
MKKVIAFVLLLCMVFSFASCGDGKKPTGNGGNGAESVKAWAFHSFEKTAVNAKPRVNDFSTDYTVYLAKGETEGCQVAIYSDKKIENATLAKKSGEADNIEVSVFSMNITHSVSKYKYTDSLIPYKEKAIDVEAKTVLPFLIEFKTNENTEAGEHKYVYEFKDGKGKLLATYNITVHVWDFELPKEKTFATSVGIAKEWITVGGEYGVYDETVYKAWYDLVLEHNMCGHLLPYDILDPRADEYMSDPRIPSFRVPIPEKEDGSIDEEKLLAYYNKLKTNKDWLDKTYFYPFDEPEYEEMVEEIRETEAKLTKLCPEIEIMIPYYTNVQLGEGRDQTDDMAEYTDKWCPKLCMWDDSYTYDGLNYTPSKSFAERMAEQQENGDIVWAYVCNTPNDPYAQLFINTDGVVQRLMFWQMYERNIEGFLYWKINYYGYEEGPAFRPNSTPQNPWETVNTQIRGDNGKVIFGCGFLFYPGTQMRAGLVVPSLRAKIVRDGIDDIEMFYLAEKYLDNDWLMEKAKEGTPTLTSYSTSDKFVSLRIEIGNALEEAMKK